jgi:hypothetical protein
MVSLHSPSVSSPGSLPPWFWHGVSPGRAVRVGLSRMAHGNREVPSNGEDLWAVYAGGCFGSGFLALIEPAEGGMLEAS